MQKKISSRKWHSKTNTNDTIEKRNPYNSTYFEKKKKKIQPYNKLNHFIFTSASFYHMRRRSTANNSIIPFV